MAINLSKGQGINLDKQRNNLSSISMGLGWDVHQPERQGFLKGLFGGAKGREFDLDGFALLLGSKGEVQAREDVIYYGNLKSGDGTVSHSGDNLTGEGEGDDEAIVLQLERMPDRYRRVVFGVCIYKGLAREQHFGRVAKAFVRAVDADGKEIARFALSGDPQYEGKVSMLMGELVRQGGAWSFRALGEVLDAGDIGEVAERYG